MDSGFFAPNMKQPSTFNLLIAHGDHAEASILQLYQFEGSLVWTGLIAGHCEQNIQSDPK